MLSASTTTATSTTVIGTTATATTATQQQKQHQQQQRKQQQHLLHVPRLTALLVEPRQWALFFCVVSAAEFVWQKIQPVRADGNLLLCTLLLGNVAVNALLSIVMAQLTSGLVGFALATTIITIFGEIIPQVRAAVHGAVGKRCAVRVRGCCPCLWRSLLVTEHVPA